MAAAVDTLHMARAWTRDVADPVWATDRPISWEAAKERLAQLLYATQTMRTAAARAAQAPAPAPAPVPQQASLAPPSAAAYAAAFVGAAHKKAPGESRLEKCTVAQREGHTVCTSQVGARAADGAGRAAGGSRGGQKSGEGGGGQLQAAERRLQRHLGHKEGARPAAVTNARGCTAPRRCAATHTRDHATTRPRDHATTRPRDHATTRSHDHAIT